MRRRRPKPPPIQPLAYLPGAEATDFWIDALSGTLMLRLMALDGEGKLVREMHMEIVPDRARSIAGLMLTKAAMAERQRGGRD